jgi:two-component system chemotaxis response regulator CheY
MNQNDRAASFAQRGKAERRPSNWVIVAEDSAATRRIVASILRECGFSVEEAANGEEALACLRERAHASLAILDWNMPVLDGLETARALRSDERFANLPILMMTTERLKDRVEAALAAGVDECLMKPFTRKMVVEKLALLGFPIR